MRWLVALAMLVGTARADELEARLVVERDLSQGGGATSLAPDAWYGVDAWTFGLVHSRAALGLVGRGASLCVDCDRVYRGSGLDARWRWRDGIEPHARLLLRDVDPMKPAVTLGARLRWTYDAFAIESDPYLRFGLANRARGNRDAAVVPVWLAFESGRWSIALHTGIDGELANWRDGWHVPVALGGHVDATREIYVSAEVGFPSLLGPQNEFKTRSVWFAVGWHR